ETDHSLREEMAGWVVLSVVIEPPWRLAPAWRAVLILWDAHSHYYTTRSRPCTRAQNIVGIRLRLTCQAGYPLASRFPLAPARNHGRPALLHIRTSVKVNQAGQTALATCKYPEPFQSSPRAGKR